MIPRSQALSWICLVLAAWLGWVFLRDSGNSGGSIAVHSQAIPGAQSTGAIQSATPEPIAPLGPLVPIADKKTEESLPLSDDFLKSIVSSDEKTVNIPLPGGGTAKGKITTLKRDANGPQYVEGTLTDPEAGRFMFQRQTVPGKAGSLVGFILCDKGNTAWQVRPTGENGKPMLVKTTADSVICRAMLAPENTEEIPPTHPDNFPIPPNENGVIQLQSLPGATAVVYLDFDGEERVFDSWGYVNAQPSGSTNSQIYEVWKGVCEDYMPFNINITTVRSVYDAAPEGRRIQVIVTPTTTVAPGAGGVAYVGSFNWSGEMVCWSFYGTGKNGVEVISHEVGHTLGLLHDGRVPSEAYYAGHPGWAPIMGVGYYQTPSQWSKGEYYYANNDQDDTSIIATQNNDTGFRADDHGEGFTIASWLDIAADGTVSNEGIIESQSDEDAFRFTTTGGLVNLDIGNVDFNPNLDIRAEILTSAGGSVAASDSESTLDASFTGLNLPAGDYYLLVSGVGKGDLFTGYSDYGSLGSYTVTGTIQGGVNEERFSVAENTPDNTVVGSVAPRADHGAGVPAFAIASGNGAGAFAINPVTGSITVANHLPLNFEVLSPRWDVPARFELFLQVSDNLGVATESIRTVITVTDVNEAPTFPAPPAVLIPEHLLAGTHITTVSASDPDRADHLTYSIIAGNTGGAFAIDPGTGSITAAGNLVYQTTPSYSLTLRATDALSPPNSVDTSLTIQLLDTPENRIPGSIVRTFFNSIPGQSIAALTTNPNFPNKPHSEQILTSFDSGAAKGDLYGSTIRGYLIAPATGSYTFWISADDTGELRISPDENPANAVVIANLTSATDPGYWDQAPGQQSATVNLNAGQAYYIEARHKEQSERDHLQIAWQPPGGGSPEIIPGRWLAPFNQDYAPWAAPSTFVTREAAINGQRVGTAAFIEPDLGQAAANYSITSGNGSGIFSINSFSGDISITNGSLLTAGQNHVLTVSASDNGSPPTLGETTVTVTVLGLHEQLQTWWKLDEGAGSVVYDSSGNSHTASISGAGSWIQRDTANSSLLLNGTNARFSYTGGEGLSGGTSFTVAAWVKIPLNLTADGMLVQQYKSGTSGHIGRYLVYIKADGKINFSIYGKDESNSTEAYQFDITSTTSIKDNTWHHVACVRDGPTGRIYIDGVQAATGSGLIRMLDPTLTVAVGYDARNNNTYLKGTVDDVRIYGDALSGQQISRIAGTPKLAVITPTGDATIPSGVGLVLETAASDPDGPAPIPTWTQLNGPGSATLTASSNTLTHAEFPAPGTYILHASVTDGTNTATQNISVSVGSTAFSPFTGFAYGGAFGGSFDYSAAEHTLIGSASGIVEGGTSDSFYMLGQSFMGDFDVRARIVSVTDIPESSNERAGLIVRAGTSGSTQETSGFIGVSAGSTGHWLRRENTGDANLEDDFPTLPFPAWCRMVRTGSLIEFQHSTDGLSWTSRGSMNLTGTVRLGLCWSSGSASGFGASAFDNVTGFSVNNTGPLVDAGGPVTATVNVASPLSGEMTDDGRPIPATPTLQWSKVSGPGEAVFSAPSSANSSVTCSAVGSYVLRLTADDGADRTFDEMTVTAEPPKTVMVEATDAIASETGPDPGTFLFTRGGPLAGDLTVNITIGGSAVDGTDYLSLPASIVIPSNVTTASLNVEPLADLLVEGTENVTLTIQSGTYQILGSPAEITLLDSNHPPSWSSPNITREDATEAAPYSGTTLATSSSDPDGNSLVFSKTSGPAWLTVHADGSLSGTPGPGDLGANSFSVRCADPGGLESDADLEIVVHFANQSPAFIIQPVVASPAIAGIAYTGESLATYCDDANLPQGDVLSFSKIDGPEWLVVAPDGSLTGTPPIDTIGLNEFTVRATDTAQSTTDVTLRITVTQAVLYLDANGSTAGSGIAGSITWNAAPLWSLDPLGATPAMPWVEGASAILSAGNDAGDCSITVTGSRLVTGLTLKDGNAAFSGDSLLLNSPASVIDVANTLTIANELAGASAGLTKSGPGTLILSGECTYSGNTSLSQGVFELTSTGRLYNNGPVNDAVITIHSGSTWRLPDFSYQGVGQLAETRERRVIDGGTIEITGPSHASGQNFTVSTMGGTLRYTAAGQLLGLSGNATDNIRIDGPLVIDALGNLAVSEILEGDGSITKTGVGRLALDSASGIAGPVHVTQGELLLNGTLPNSQITVDAGARIAGQGGTSQSLDVAGTLAPGDSIGQLTCGALTLDSGAGIEWQISDWTGTPGSGFDQVSATSLDLTEANPLTVTLHSLTLQNFTDTLTSFVLVDTTSGITGFNAAAFTLDASGIPEATGHWSLRVDGNQLLLDYTPLTPFETWQLAQFGPDATNPLIAGEQADPDSDGMVNLMEYALGTLPNTPSATSIIYDFESVEGTDYLRTTIQRNPAATDVTFLVEASSDPSDSQSWTDAGTVVETDTPALLVVRDTVSGSKRLMRLRVTH